MKLAWVNIYMPFITTRAKCDVLSDPCADLIVGKKEGVKEVDARATDEWKRERMT